MRLTERYTVAVHSSNLDVDPDTTYSDSDVLGAAGLAAKRHPLAVQLMRLFAGDNHAAAEIVGTMSRMVHARAIKTNAKLRRVQADDMAKAVLAWYRDGICQACHGHGFELIAGTPALSDQQCKACGGTGKKPFDRQFKANTELARWLLAEVERETAKAGPAAMKALAPRLNVD